MSFDSTCTAATTLLVDDDEDSWVDKVPLLMDAMESRIQNKLKEGFSTLIEVVDHGLQANWNKMHELHEQQRDYFDKHMVSHKDEIIILFTNLLKTLTDDVVTNFTTTEKLHLMFVEKLEQFQTRIIKRLLLLEDHMHIVYTVDLMHDRDNERYLKSLLESVEALADTWNGKPVAEPRDVSKDFVLPSDSLHVIGGRQIVLCGERIEAHRLADTQDEPSVSVTEEIELPPKM